MLNTAIFIHANLQYAEIPSSHIPRVVNQSYLPFLRTLLHIPNVKVVLNFTGVTLEILNKEYPEVLDIVKQGINQGKFEITGCAYSHPILPLLSTHYVNIQIKEHLRLLKRTLGITKPRGFWLPEAAWDPSLAVILRSYGFEWTVVDYDHVLLSKQGWNITQPLKRKHRSLMAIFLDMMSSSPAKKVFNALALYKKYRQDINQSDFEPITIRGSSRTLTGLLANQTWTFYTNLCLMNKWPFTQKTIKKSIKKQKNKMKGLFIPFACDMEIIGYKGNLLASISVKSFIDFVGWLSRTKNIQLLFPTDYLNDAKAKGEVYLQTGSWSPDRTLELWSKGADNERLEQLCKEAEQCISNTKNKHKKKKVTHHLLMAQNSDGRGWNPLPEKRLACFEHATKAIELCKSELN